MSRALAWLLAVATGCAVVGKGDHPSSARFRSPEGSRTVAFEQLAHPRFSDEERRESIDNVDHVVWTIVFADVVTGAVLARAEYADVYGFDPSPRPSTPQEIFARLWWSPEEDFVVLPAEGWAGAPGTPEQTAVALDPELMWTLAGFVLDRAVWVDRLVAVGERLNDCDYSVDMFDGGAGQQRPLFPSASPRGYRLVEVRGGTVLVREVLDNCAPQELQRSFTGQCRTLDLDSLDATDAPCPSR